MGHAPFLQALEYKQAIKEALPEHSGFEPLMTLYLTDKTEPEEVHAAKDAGIVAFKMYPAGATTNSDSGVTDVNRCLPTLNAMAEVHSCPLPPFVFCQIARPSIVFVHSLASWVWGIRASLLRNRLFVLQTVRNPWGCGRACLLAGWHTAPCSW